MKAYEMKRPAGITVSVLMAVLAGLTDLAAPLNAQAALITHTIVVQSDATENLTDNSLSDTLSIDPFVRDGVNMGFQQKMSVEAACLTGCVDLTTTLEFIMTNRNWVGVGPAGRQIRVVETPEDRFSDLAQIFNSGTNAFLRLTSDNDPGMPFAFNEEITATCTTSICTATFTQDSIDVSEPAAWLLFCTGVVSLVGCGLLQRKQVRFAAVTPLRSGSHSLV
jgi:hypothetical protein